MISLNLRQYEKNNLLIVLPEAHKQALEKQSTVYVMLDTTKHCTRTKGRLCYGQAPQAGYLIIAVVNPAIVWIFWKLVDPIYPQYTEYVDKIQHSVPCEVW